jgi:hypothetical protein
MEIRIEAGFQAKLPFEQYVPSIDMTDNCLYVGSGSESLQDVLGILF